MFRSFYPYAEEKPPVGFRAPPLDPAPEQMLVAVKTPLGWARPVHKPSGELLLEIDGQERPLHHFEPSSLRPVAQGDQRGRPANGWPTMEQPHPLDEMLTSLGDNRRNGLGLQVLDRDRADTMGVGASALVDWRTGAPGARPGPVNALWSEQGGARSWERQPQASVSLVADYRPIPPGVPEVVRGARHTQAELEQGVRAAGQQARKRFDPLYVDPSIKPNPAGGAGAAPLAGFRDLASEIRSRAGQLRGAAEDARKRMEQAGRETRQKLGEAAEDTKRQAAQRTAEAAARALIPPAINHPATTPSAKEVLTSFYTGKGRRHFEFGERDPATRELFAADPGGYFQGQINDMAAFIADRDHTPYLRNGQKIDNWRGKKFGSPKDISGLADGVQIGDVVGSMRWSAVVKGGMMQVTATNTTSLESFGAENRGRHGLVKGPKGGPLSPVTQTFTFKAPIPAKFRAPEREKQR